MVRVLVVDHRPALRVGLFAILRAEPGLVPVGAVGPAEDLESAIGRTAPDVVVLDGLPLCRRVRAAPGRPPVVLYTDAPLARIADAARRAGADAVVEQSEPGGVLVDVLRAVARTRAPVA